MFAGRFRYECIATFKITGEITPAILSDYQHAIVAYAWDELGSRPVEAPTKPAWSVDTTGSDTLRLVLTADDRKAGVARVRHISESFLQDLQAQSEKARSTPNESERVYSSFIDHLSRQVNEAQERMAAMRSKLPDWDPLVERTSILERWDRVRARLDHDRDILSKTTADLEGLECQPEPSHGLVSAQERQEAIESDLALQQDLEELRVNLTELKLHLLNVWQQTAGPLESLGHSLSPLQSTLGEDATDRPTSTPGRGGKLVDIVTDCSRRLVRFNREWNKAFGDVQSMAVDPFSAALLTSYQRIRRLVSDYLFESSKQWTKMRRAVRDVRMDPRDDARFHVYQSRIIRAFETSQADYHRFEFAAAGLETPNNFRLDASLKSVRGLSRRTQSRLQRINERLQIKALKKARKRRLQALTQTRRRLQDARAAVDQSLDELLRLQDDLNRITERTDGFQQARFRAELAAARLAFTTGGLSRVKNQLEHLTTERIKKANATSITLVSTDASSSPINLRRRLGLAALSAGLVGIAVLLGQWMVVRHGRR